VGRAQSYLRGRGGGRNLDRSRNYQSGRKISAHKIPSSGEDTSMTQKVNPPVQRSKILGLKGQPGKTLKMSTRSIFRNKVSRGFNNSSPTEEREIFTDAVHNRKGREIRGRGRAPYGLGGGLPEGGSGGGLRRGEKSHMEGSNLADRSETRGGGGKVGPNGGHKKK